MIEHEEIEKAVSLIHTKSFSEASDIRHLYKDIDHDVEETLDKLLKGLPSDAKEREKIITAELEQLNHVMTKLDGQVALDFYNSLRNFAVHVAQTSGGVFGMLKLNFHEKEVVKLPMLAKPSH